jgi:lysyl-tRNA synthetase class 2
MFPELKNSDWRPTAGFDHLRARADLLRTVRNFFSKKDVLEVDTPLMCRFAPTATYISPIPVYYAAHAKPFYLQTSPEYAMKRLLAAGSGSIYQICKAFRNSEEGRLHNPEFTMLEWYRLGFDHHVLMDEVDELLILTLDCQKAERVTYQALFLQHLQLDPLTASRQQLEECAIAKNIQVAKEVVAKLTIDDWLDLLMSHCIEPVLGFNQPVMVYDFPASKAALAKITEENPSVAERFEVYVQGIELANGYHELTDPNTQLARFQMDVVLREDLGLPFIAIDPYLVQALQAGLPPSAGIALGFDRLVMLKVQQFNIQAVIPFTVDRV